jgi:hypothetical protein
MAVAHGPDGFASRSTRAAAGIRGGGSEAGRPEGRENGMTHDKLQHAVRILGLGDRATLAEIKAR